MSVCRHCNGEGYVLDRLVIAMSFGMLGILGWLMSDGDQTRDIHKEICGRCRGTGEEP